jgi:O-antigen ligase
MKFGERILAVMIVPLIALTIYWLAGHRPGYFTNVSYLGGLLLMEVVIVAVWHYEKVFFAVLMLAFLWGGTALPMEHAGMAARWVFLFAAAAVGLVRWLEHPHRQPFGAFHVVAALCLLSASVSGMVSSRSEISLLKTASLFLLFLYGSCGARVAFAGREGAFFLGLLNGSEMIAYLTAFLYFIARWAVFGNPNSLGAVMGVVVVPLLMWGVLISEDRQVKQRRIVALCLATLLLVFSASRAGILACAFSVVLTCIALRRGTLLLKGAMVVVFLVTALAVIQPERLDSLTNTVTDDVVYKGKREQGLLGSRKDPWQVTVDVIKESPWFGSGFGTDDLRTTLQADSMIRMVEGNNREHGSSYLTLLQYMGLFGVIPFVILLVMVSAQMFRAFRWMWRTGTPRHYAVPLAMICLAGLTHAVFEDWLFAVGYYLSVFFWTCVFILHDAQPRAAREAVSLPAVWTHAPAHGAAVISAHQ